MNKEKLLPALVSTLEFSSMFLMFTLCLQILIDTCSGTINFVPVKQGLNHFIPGSWRIGEMNKNCKNDRINSVT